MICDAEIGWYPDASHTSVYADYIPGINEKRDGCAFASVAKVEVHAKMDRGTGRLPKRGSDRKPQETIEKHFAFDRANFHCPMRCRRTPSHGSIRSFP